VLSNAMLRTRVAVVALVVCVSAVIGGAALRGASAADRPALSRMGFSPGSGGVASLHSLESWLGRDTHYVMTFTDYTGGSAFESSIWGETVNTGGYQTIANRTNFVESVPLTLGLGFGATTAQRAAALAATAAGRNDAAFRVGAQYIKAANFAGVTIRLGWEFDGNWMPWSAAGNESLWIQAYRHVHDVFKSIIPNARFDWTGDVGWMPRETSAYPGDGYVDVIGMDVYDKSLASPWNPATHSWVNAEAAFNTDVPSLTFQRNFAISHGKQVSYPEWALATGGSEAPTSAGGDNPTFIQGMYNWMNSLPSSGAGSLAYQTYYNDDADGHDGYHALSHFPNAQARFRALFGGPDSGNWRPSAPIRYASTPGTCAPKAKSATSGYSLLGADGVVYAFGKACNVGNAAGSAIAIANRAGGKGYWIVDMAGHVSHFGTAANLGGSPALRSGEWITSISATRTGRGYWLFSSRGRVFAYGDAHFYGDLRSKHLNGPVIASVASPSGHGYRMVGSDGGVFSFGDAHFRGSMGNTHLNGAIVGVSATADGRGYWLVGSDGGVFAFDAPFRGSMGGRRLVKPVNGLVAYGNGYLMVASDGGVFDFSNKAFTGSLGNHTPSAPIIDITPVG
jgi:hypothetical protein